MGAARGDDDFVMPWKAEGAPAPFWSWTGVRGLHKVPKITVYFWIIKICCTTVGESLSDLFNSQMNLGLGVTAAIFFPLFLGVVAFQTIVLRRYMTSIYWLAVVLTSICGTIATDGFHDNLGIELWIEIVVFFVLMVGTFAWWFWCERTLDIKSIWTMRRETFYWFTIFWTFAMGTAVGDATGEAIINQWPTATLGVIFGIFVGILGIILLVWVGLKLAKLCPSGSACEITIFWLAYIFTRPLGASLGDLLSISPVSAPGPAPAPAPGGLVLSPGPAPSSGDNSGGDPPGGAGLGTETTSFIFLGVIVVCLLFCLETKVDVIKEKPPGYYGAPASDQGSNASTTKIDVGKDSAEEGHYA